MDRELDFTYDPVRFAGLPAYVRELKAKGIKFITILVRTYL
jgi:alpha-glucosidase (family GH31 glycosyl hydrolase)